MSIINRLDEIQARASRAGKALGVYLEDWHPYEDVVEEVLYETAANEVPEFVVALKRVEALLAQYEADDREHLNTFGQHHPCAVWAAAQLREALTGEA